MISALRRQVCEGEDASVNMPVLSDGHPSHTLPRRGHFPRSLVLSFLVFTHPSGQRGSPSTQGGGKAGPGLSYNPPTQGASASGP